MGGQLDRRKVRGLLLSAEDEGLKEIIGGQEYFFKREPRCKVCKLPPSKRDFIDRMLVLGYTYAQIRKSCVDPGQLNVPQVTYSSIRTHDQRHLQYENAAIREFVRRRAEQDGMNYIEGTQRVLTGLALTDLVMSQTFDGIINGELKVTVNDGLRAVSLQESIKGEELKNFGVQLAYQQLGLIIEVVREELTPEQWHRVALKLQEEGMKRGLIQGATTKSFGTAEDVTDAEFEEVDEDEDVEYVECDIPEGDPRCLGDCDTCTLIEETTDGDHEA